LNFKYQLREFTLEGVVSWNRRVHIIIAKCDPQGFSTPDKFENGSFTLKTHEMFSVHTTPEEFKNATITVDLCLRSHYRDAIVFEKCLFSKLVFRPHQNEQQAFMNFPSLKSVFKKLRFRDGLVWTVGLTVETKLRFQISLA